MRRWVTVVLILSVALPALGQRAERRAKVAQGEKEIRALLDRQVAAWNQGDLEGFMAGYWKSEDLTFFAGGTVVKGWQGTLDRYKKKYQSGGNQMGTLDFSGVEILPLGPRAAMARAHWHLVLPGNKEPRGLTTLILRKLPEGWRIVHDHSSAE